MDDGVVPRTRNLRPRKPYVDPFLQPRRSVRRARARLSAADFLVLDNEEDGDWSGAADDEVGDEEVVELGAASRRSHRSHRRVPGRREASRVPRHSSEPAPKKRTRKPKVVLPEDVPFREPVQPQPEADPEDAAHAPSIAFIAIFVATFPSLFEDLGRLPAPQDLEAGLLSPEPSELVDFVFRRVLGCVLNRKKEIEPGRYASALSELHAQRNSLGMGPWFPPLQWKSRGNAFAELKWYDRLELLHVLVHWSLSASDRVRQLLRQLDDEAVNPWMGADAAGNHYYIVGFDPVAEGAEEHTPFRVYKESNRLLQTVKWEPVASSATEVQHFLDSHVKRPAAEADSKRLQLGNAQKDSQASDAQVSDSNMQDSSIADVAMEDVQLDGADKTDVVDTDGQEIDTPGSADKKEGVVTGVDRLGGEAGDDPAAEAPLDTETQPVEYNLPTSVVDTLLHFLPAMHRSEAVAAERQQKEAKRARRRNDIMWQAENISNGGGRYAGRTRGRKIDYAELLRDTVDDDDDENRPRKRRLRQRDTNYEWHEPEPETRQQRHARIMAERAAERANWSSNDVSIEPTPDYTSSAFSSHVDSAAAPTEAWEDDTVATPTTEQVHSNADNVSGKPNGDSMREGNDEIGSHEQHTSEADASLGQSNEQSSASQLRTEVLQPSKVGITDNVHAAHSDGIGATHGVESTTGEAAPSAAEREISPSSTEPFSRTPGAQSTETSSAEPLNFAVAAPGQVPGTQASYPAAQAPVSAQYLDAASHLGVESSGELDARDGSTLQREPQPQSQPQPPNLQ